MNKEALLRLADKLEGRGPYEKVGPVPADRFVMLGWFSVRTMDEEYPFEEAEIGDERTRMAKQILEHNSCGTAACACGWASTDPYFQKLGLKPETFSWAEVEKAFELEFEEAEFLFNDETYHDRFDVTPSEVAQRIRDFVAKS